MSPIYCVLCINLSIPNCIELNIMNIYVAQQMYSCYFNQMILSCLCVAAFQTCYFQYSVTLQSEETISEECRKKTAQGSSITSYVRSQDMCLHTLKSHFNVPVPLTATPGFITDIGMT